MVTVRQQQKERVNMPMTKEQVESYPLAFYAEHNHISIRTLWRAIANGDLKCIRFGRAVRVTPEQWRAYIERGEA